MSADAEIEFTHPIRMDGIGSKTVTVTLSPNDAARAALAERLDLVALPSLSAKVSVRRRNDSGWVEVSGTLVADVVQDCVVTLEPVPARVEVEIAEMFVEADSEDDVFKGSTGAVELDPIADMPEPVEGDTLDLAEIVAQSLSLSLDPYPRAPEADAALETDAETGAKAGGGAGADDGTADRVSPFAELQALRDRLANDNGAEKA
jgi:uncharacterized metal-binding protein YceD (DUF177 family)